MKFRQFKEIHWILKDSLGLTGWIWRNLLLNTYNVLQELFAPLSPHLPFLEKNLRVQTKIFFLNFIKNMGSGNSKGTRSVSIDNDQPAGIIDVSEDVVSRLKSNLAKGKNQFQ